MFTDQSEGRSIGDEASTMKWISIRDSVGFSSVHSSTLKKSPFPYVWQKFPLVISIIVSEIYQHHTSRRLQNSTSKHVVERRKDERIP